MKREVRPTPAFTRASKRLIKQQPEADDEIRAAVDLLREDAFQPSLRTHKLKGKLAGRYACSLGYDLRIVFKIVERDGAEAVLLLNVGTHDTVY